MNILLFFPKLCESKDYHYMPITALAVASELLAQGHRVEIWDDRVDDINIRSLGALISHCDQVMVSCFTGYQLSQAYRFIKETKEKFPDKKIVVGGPHATALPEQTLASPYVDEVFCGDIDTGKHPLPYHLIYLDKYVNPATERFIQITQYGCPGICSFCSTKKKRPLKLIPMERVKTDIDYLMKRHSFRECVFFDSTLFMIPDRVRQISEIMRQYQLRWICDARAPEIANADESFLESCVNSGLTQITVGLESGSPGIIRLMHKGSTHLEYYRQAAEKLARLPVKLVSGVIFGTPGETVLDLQLTIDYIQRIRGINPNFHISTTFFRPLPGTAMTDLAMEYGYKEPQSLSEWAELGMRSHYSYNEYREACWIPEPDRHRAVYEKFRTQNKDLFV